MSETLLVVLVLLACPIGMGLMMWFMMRQRDQNQTEPKKPASGPRYNAQAAEAARLQAEIDQLKAAQRDSAAHRKPAPPGDRPPPPD